MNLVILGAAGATGLPLVEQACAAGHHVAALVRSQAQLAAASPGLRVVQGDATDQSAVSRALEGTDAVISVLGARRPVMADATRVLVAAAREKRVRRVVMLSSFAVERDRLTPVAKWITDMVMGVQIKDKSAGEHLLRASDLDWTIVYAVRLTNGPKTSAVIVPETAKIGLSQTISRADVAAFLLQAAADHLYSRRAVTITGSK